VFDKYWEKIIYKNNKHINNYPYDWVVSSVNKFVNYKKNALELGSGTANHLIFLSKFGFKNVLGLEASKTAIKISKEKIKKKKNIFLKKIDFNKFKYKKNYYDLILDKTSLTHNKISDIKKTLKKINYSLTDNGLFFSVMSNKYASFDTSKKDKRAFKFVTPGKKGLLTNFFSKSEIIQLFKDFVILELKEELHIIHKPMKTKFSSWNIICKKIL
jgi:hypothetical protein